MASDSLATSSQPVLGGVVEAGYPAVGLVRNSEGYCTGTLIAPDYVLTAAHCLGEGMSFSSDAEWRAVDRGYAHPNEDYDLAILHLSTPIRSILPMALDFRGRPPEGKECIAVGFGEHKEPNGAVTDGKKHSATVRVSSSFLNMFLTDEAFPVDWVTGISTSGDSGGPLLCDGVISGAVKMHADGQLGNHTTEYYTPIEYNWLTDVVGSEAEPTISTVVSGNNEVSAFFRGADGGVYRQVVIDGKPSPGPGTFEVLGGFTVGSPEAVSRGPGRIDLFARGADRTLFIKVRENNQWYPSQYDWWSMGRVLTSHPSVVSSGPNRLDVFGLSEGGSMLYRSFDGANWQDYVDLGGEFYDSIKAVSWGPGRLDIFAIGLDRAIYHRWAENGVWSPAWDYLGGWFPGGISVISSAPNRIEIAARGENNRAYFKRWDGSAWLPSNDTYQDLGGQWKGTPTLTSWGPGHLDLFTHGNNNHVYHKWAFDYVWGPAGDAWESQGGSLAMGSVAPVSAQTNKIDIFYLDSDRMLRHKNWAGKWLPSSSGDERLGGRVTW